MTEKEIFNSSEHKQQIDELFYPALALYVLVLSAAHVPPEDISRISEALTERSASGLRRARDFVSFTRKLK